MNLEINNFECELTELNANGYLSKQIRTNSLFCVAIWYSIVYKFPLELQISQQSLSRLKADIAPLK